MLYMTDLPYTPVMQEITLKDDLLLDDTAFSNKGTQIAKKGDIIKIKECANYGLVIHPEFGIFRY